MDDIVIGSIVIALLALVLNIIIDYFILKVDKDLIQFTKGLHKNKKYLLIYIVSIVIQTAIFIFMGLSHVFYLCYIVSLIFYRIAVIDYETLYVDNKLLILFIMIAFCSLAIDNNVSIIGSILTGIATYIILALISKISNEALGMGDVKVLALLGIIFGFQGLMSILMVSSIIVFFVSLFLLIKSKKNRNKELPFTPYIYAGLVFMIIASNI